MYVSLIGFQEEKMKTIYLLRHCKAEGQDSDAPLTKEGKKDALSLVEYLKPLGISTIISSPYIRTIHTAAPFAAEIGVSIKQDERLAERVLTGKPVDNWLELLKQTFHDENLQLKGGESSKEATQRALAVVYEEVGNLNEISLLVTHGNLMSLLLRHFDASFGFQEWSNLSNPDLYRIDLFSTKGVMKRVWNQR